MSNNHIIYGVKIGDYFVHIGSYREGSKSGLTKAYKEYPGCTLWKIQELGDVPERTITGYREGYRTANGLPSGGSPLSIVLNPKLVQINYVPYNARPNGNRQPNRKYVENRPRVRRAKAIFINHHKPGDKNGFWDFDTRRIVLLDTSK